MTGPAPGGAAMTGPAPGGAAVAAAGLTKRYGPVTAVEDLSIHVGPGDIYALLGLNGAGKTTTIRMLLGMVRPTAGEASVLGTRVRPGARALWVRVGYLVESPAAYPELTVRENLEVARRLRALTSKRCVDEIIERLALAPYADRRARTLSQGNAQRLGLAKALLHRPELLVLDEPANGLDPAGVVEVRALLRDLAGEHGTTVFLSSHILAEVARLATRVGIVHRGRLLRELDAEDLSRQEGARLAVSTRDAAVAVAALRAAGFTPTGISGSHLTLRDQRALQRPDEVATLLVRAGCPPTRLAVEHEDLEAYFLRLVATDPGDGHA